MSYRALRPNSTGVGESSASTSGPSLLTPESSESGPGIAPSIEKGREEVDSGSHTKQPKRRKVPETVTRNACSNCKRARAKCDGQVPCSRCSTRGEPECVYEIHVKHAKEEMVKQIKDFTAHEQLTGKILTAIASGSDQTPNIIQRLQDGDSLSTIVDSLAQDVPDVPMEDFLSRRNSADYVLDHHEVEPASKGFQWTTVTSDERVLRHLFSLYFSWIHPVYTLFHEGNFVSNYQTNTHRHCSHVLVNAICAMACQMHTKQKHRKDQVDYESLGIRFMNAARSLVRPEIEDLSTVQALNIMFLFDYSRGKGHRASTYLKIATRILARMKLPLQDGCLENCSKDTICGTEQLNVEWAQMTSQAPIDCLDVPLELLGQNVVVKDNLHWYYYRFEADEVPAWPCLLATTTHERAKLTAIIRDVTELYYGYRRAKISASQILELHKRYTRWREELPPSLGDFEKHSQALPHVLTMLILFHAAVTQLLRPILSLNDIPLGTMMAIEEEIWGHAQMGLYLLERHYRTHWTCRYQPVQQLFSVLHLSDIVARFFPGRTDPNSKNGLEAVQLAMDVFKGSSEGFPISGQFQDVLYRVASECTFDLPQDWKDHMPSQGNISNSLDDTIEACGNASFLQPLDDILTRYQSTFAREWVIEAPGYEFKARAGTPRRRRPLDSAELAAENLMRIRNLLNTN